jgi:class 3 adenylate cyclase
MIERPSVKYAVSDGVSIAYTRFGRGDEVVVYTPPWVSNVELYWDLAEYSRAYERAGMHLEVITIDKRGVGLSDRTDTPPTLEDRIADTLAVMDAEGVDRAHMLGFSEGASVAIAIASRHSDRVESVSLVGSGLPGVPGRVLRPFFAPEDPPFSGLTRIREVVDAWGTDESLLVEYFTPSAVGDERVRSWARRFERQSASPGTVRAHLKSALEADISGDLDGIDCPVFIGHSIGDQIVPVATSRFLAGRFPDATVRLWDATDHDLVFSANWADMQADLIEFVTGVRPVAIGRGRFGVVLFTDIVGSTSEAFDAGDDRWARLLAAHDAVSDLVIAEYGGRKVKSTGDGLLAIFDNPIAAVECTRRLLDRLTELGLKVRAGLHAGQVQVHENGDISGTAVNIAARVEPLAEPGCVCVSRTIADLLLGEDFSFDSLGPQDLKGIEQPIEVFSLAAR